MRGATCSSEKQDRETRSKDSTGEIRTCEGGPDGKQQKLDKGSVCKDTGAYSSEKQDQETSSKDSTGDLRTCDGGPNVKRQKLDHVQSDAEVKTKDSSSCEGIGDNCVIPARPGFEWDKWFPDEKCVQCRIRYIDPRPKDLIMYLHALRYKVIL